MPTRGASNIGGNSGSIISYNNLEEEDLLSIRNSDNFGNLNSSVAMDNHHLGDIPDLSSNLTLGDFDLCEGIDSSCLDDISCPLPKTIENKKASFGIKPGNYSCFVTKENYLTNYLLSIVNRDGKAPLWLRPLAAFLEFFKIYGFGQTNCASCATAVAETLENNDVYLAMPKLRGADVKGIMGLPVNSGESFDELLAKLQQLKPGDELLTKLQHLLSKDELLTKLQQLKPGDEQLTKLQQLKPGDELLAKLQQLKPGDELLIKLQHLLSGNELLTKLQQLKSTDDPLTILQQLKREDELNGVIVIHRPARWQWLPGATQGHACNLIKFKDSNFIHFFDAQKKTYVECHLNNIAGKGAEISKFLGPIGAGGIDLYMKKMHTDINRRPEHQPQPNG